MCRALTVLHRRLGSDGAASRRVRSERGRAGQRAVDPAARRRHLRPRTSLPVPHRTVSRVFCHSITHSLATARRLTGAQRVLR